MVHVSHDRRHMFISNLRASVTFSLTNPLPHLTFSTKLASRQYSHRASASSRGESTARTFTREHSFHMMS